MDKYMQTQIKIRMLLLGFFTAALVAIFWEPFKSLVEITSKSPQYSHIILVPLITLFLVFFERRKIFTDLRYSWVAGALGVLVGVVLYMLGRWYSGGLSPNDALSLAIASFVVIWEAGVVIFFGATAFRKGLFPWLSLLFIIPFPDFFVNNFLLTIRGGSAEVCYAILRIVGVPVFRDGWVFSVPGVSIEVARECSGIHSSIALLIVSLIAGRLFLRAFWRKALLTVFVVPIVGLTNGLRITVLTLIAAYVDRSILDSDLHHKGGGIFFVLALLLLAALLRWLSKTEAKAGSVSATGSESAVGRTVDSRN
jgi:exosortase